MNLIRLMRSQAGVTQQVLAHKAGTSQPAIASYESGAKSPTLATLQRLASSLGLELAVTYVPKLTREDYRSLVYHRGVTEKLMKDSASAIKRAKRNLNEWRKRHPGANKLFDRWNIWLRLPVEELIFRMLDPGIAARDMRQVSPFTGILTPQERARILKRFRKEYGL